MSTARTSSVTTAVSPDSVRTGAVWTEPLRDGTSVTIRALHVEDIELERRFIEALSPTSRRFRFLETMNSPSEALLKPRLHARAVCTRCIRQMQQATI